MTPYQKEQLQTLQLVRRYLAQITEAEHETLKDDLDDYLAFREAVDAFHDKNLLDI